jgi:DNA modification methylase
VAALNLGRRFIGIEKDTTYYDIANKRIQDVVDRTV